MKKLAFTAALVAVILVSAKLQAQDRFKPLGESAEKYQPRMLEIFNLSLYDHFQGPAESALDHEFSSDPMRQAAVRDVELREVNELYMYFLVMGCRHEEAIEMVEYVLIAMPDSGQWGPMR